MDGWMDIHPTPLASGSTTDDRRARGSTHPSIEPMQPISLLAGVSNPRWTIGWSRDARVENARRDDDGSVGFARMDRASRWMDGSRVRRVMDFGFGFFTERLGAAGVFLFLFNETRVTD